MGIKEFYKQKDVFITGGSGFIGKLLIEKLLYSCPDVGNIFVLLRPKRNKDAEARLKDFLADPAFDRVRKVQPTALHRVHAIGGDCGELGLGISGADLTRMRNVGIIFHSAASVRFVDPLSNAILINTRGTLELLKIAETLSQLKAFIHVSTTYCNPERDEVEERLYAPYADWREAIKMAEYYDEETLMIFAPKIVDQQPNTYTFTKGLAEQIVNEYRDRVPVLILRPSVVITAYREPMPGWVDNFNGPIGMAVAIGLGFASAAYMRADTGIDMIPVDVVVRSMILAAYKRAGGDADWQQVAKPDASVEVINCAAGKYHHLTNDEYNRTGIDTAFENPFKFAIWTPAARITNCFYWYWLQVMVLDLPRGVLLDLLIKMFKKKPICMATQRRLFQTSQILHFFNCRLYHFHVEKCLALNGLLRNKAEYDEFGLADLTDYSLKELFKNAVRALKMLKLNESGDSDRESYIRVRVYWVISMLMRGFILWHLVKYIWRVLLPKLMGLDVVANDVYL